MTAQTLNHGHNGAHQGVNPKVVFGFWVFILTDFILFAALFATYSVLHNNTFGAMGIKEITRLSYVMIQSLIFLTSSFTCGMAIVALRNEQRSKVMAWLFVTFLLGLSFVGLEYKEFTGLIHAGATWHTSAFLSSFFTLVGLHACHVVVGLLWILILMLQLTMQGTTSTMMKTRLACLGLFWDFLNIIWVFIFSIVYLMGAI